MTKAILNWGPLISLFVVQVWSSSPGDFRDGILFAWMIITWFGMTHVVERIDELIENNNYGRSQNDNINNHSNTIR